MLLITINTPTLIGHTVKLSGPAMGYLLYLACAGGGELAGALLSLALADRAGRRATLAGACAANALCCAAALVALMDGASKHTTWGFALMLSSLWGIMAAQTAGALLEWVGGFVLREEKWDGGELD